MAKSNTAQKLDNENDAPELKDPTTADGQAALSRLFKAYGELDAEVLKINAALEKLLAKRSDLVKSIGEYGKGPYKLADGKKLTVTSRRNEELNTVRYFFKGQSEQEIINIK